MDDSDFICFCFVAHKRCHTTEMWHTTIVLVHTAHTNCREKKNKNESSMIWQFHAKIINMATHVYVFVSFYEHWTHTHTHTRARFACIRNVNSTINTLDSHVCFFSLFLFGNGWPNPYVRRQIIAIAIAMATAPTETTWTTIAATEKTSYNVPEHIFRFVLF